MYLDNICIVFSMFLMGAIAMCPHEMNIPRWSNASSWPNGKPSVNDSVTIDGPLLLDEPFLDLGDITITTTGWLVFDPEVVIELRTTNIIVNGSLIIGSEDCPYETQLNIILKGNITDHAGEAVPKSILVNSGGVLDIHGERKLSWTKITSTLQPLESSGDLLFEHAKFDPFDPSIPYDQWEDRAFINGIAAYTIRCDNNSNPVIKNFSEYELVSEGSQLAARIEAVEDGEILMLASQKTIRLKDKKSEQELAFDALERLLFGEVTGTSLLRHVTSSSTYALVYQKDGGKISYVEKSGPKGVDSIAQFVSMERLVFEAFTLGASKPSLQFDNFRIRTYDGLYPLVNTVDDVTSWSVGDTVVFSSTDYDWKQTEERTVVRCLLCTNKQFRVNAPLTYMHWGEFIHEAVDMRAEVALLTRNIVIEGTVEDSCPVENGNCDKDEVMGLDTFGGQIKVLGTYGAVHIEGVVLYHMGQQTVPGGYPLYFYMNQDSFTSPYIMDSIIYKSFAHCVALRAANDIQVIDNFCYDEMGHGFILEDGAELNNTFDGNLVIGTRKGTGDLEITDLSDPTSFWITNPNNRVCNNVAGGGQGGGLWFIYPDYPLEPSTSLNTMDRFEARSTPIEEFYNNAAHSNNNIGVTIGSRLEDDRTISAANTWQPRSDPKDPSSTPLDFIIEKITGYKNRRNNVWVEGGTITLKKVSSSDSLNGVTLTNDGLVDVFTGVLTDSVIVGDSSNIGVPSTIPTRSIPIDKTEEEPHSGLTLWKGPTMVKDLWFGGNYQSDYYDIGAIAVKRFSPYFYSVQTRLSNLLFAFDDVKSGPVRAISGLQGVDPGWKSRDGALISGFTMVTNETGLNNVTYVVRPDHLSAAAKTCRVRSGWRHALCTTKYGNIKLSSSKETVFVRDDVPSAQLEFAMSGNTGPQVVLDGSRMVTLHFPSKIAPKLVLKGEGMERGDVLIVGVCLPRNGDFLLKSNTPVKIKPDEFVAVDSFNELRRTTADDGRKYYLNNVTGMFYYKFVDIRVKGPDEINTCKDGRCPDLIIDKIKGSKDDADCRERVYGDDLNMPLPSQKTFEQPIPANGGETPPDGWGAGSTRPFEKGTPVDGGYGNWSVWSECSKTCDNGTKYRNRKCNNPLPRDGGMPCMEPWVEIMPCRLIYCPIDGEFTEWSEWSACEIRSENECQGRSRRTRTCTNPVPQYNGIDCEGAIEETRPCDNCIRKL